MTTMNEMEAKARVAARNDNVATLKTSKGMKSDFAIYEHAGRAHLDIVAAFNGGDWQQIACHTFDSLSDAWEMARLMGFAN
jgi:hypothetical protein